MSEKVTVSDVYSALVDLSIHTEEITWSRFSNYLLFSSILIVAWATMWATDYGRNPIVLSGFCVVGILSGIFWSLLGLRGRKMLKKLYEMTTDLEKDTSVWGEGLQSYRGLDMLLALRDKLPFGWAGSTQILVGCPLVISALYFVMLAVTQGWCFR